MDRQIEEIWNLFNSLYPSQEEEQRALSNAPLLAHYTSIDALEKIVETEEIWFSNPLFMNDLEEVRFGVVQGSEILRTSDVLLNSLATDVRRAMFTTILNKYIAQFEQDHLFDTYVFCLSNHDVKDSDGRLSMWRGYGGNGRGAAIIFDTSKITLLPDSPLIVSRVHYGSAQKRLDWVKDLAKKIAVIISKSQIPDDKIYVVAKTAFERLKLFALFSKHIGFAEEDEWRIVYMPDRDTTERLKPMMNYQNGPRGVEPKLRLKLAPLDGVIPNTVTLESIVAKILLGPNSSSVLALRSVSRMLELLKRPNLVGRLAASSIPLRGATA